MNILFRIILNDEYWIYENNDKKWTKQRKPTIVMLLKQLLLHLFLFKYIQYKWIWTTIHIVIWSVLVVVNIFLNCLNDVEWWVYEIYQFVYFVLFFVVLSNFFRLFFRCFIFLWFITFYLLTKTTFFQKFFRKQNEQPFTNIKTFPSNYLETFVPENIYYQNKQKMMQNSII